jgi:hypothetical protein
MITFVDWMLLAEGRKSNKNKKGKTPKILTPPKNKDGEIVGKIDITKLPTGHKPHMSGAGIHGEKDAPRKKNWKDQLN